ncbi:MAG: SDR family oxidoreductase [Alphaproteobacteria bacterium]|nr:SDR family oxidoreductase [Alphaproteobacteria bacterium]
MTFQYKKALVIGGSRGVGRDLSIKLAERDIATVSVARNSADLEKLKAEAPAIDIIAIDAAGEGVAESLLADHDPDLLLLVGGHSPKMQSIADMSWSDFSAAWETDTKIAFQFIRAALREPMAEGGAIVSFASGAAIGGSPLSGGYAGAKRMQHLVANYGQWEAEQRGLGLTFMTIYPKQLVAGTGIAEKASTAYAAARSMSPEQFMSQWDKPLTPQFIGDQVIELLRENAGSATYGITASGREIMN